MSTFFSPGKNNLIPIRKVTVSHEHTRTNLWVLGRSKIPLLLQASLIFTGLGATVQRLGEPSAEDYGHIVTSGFPQSSGVLWPPPYSPPQSFPLSQNLWEILTLFFFFKQQRALGISSLIPVVLTLLGSWALPSTQEARHPRGPPSTGLCHGACPPSSTPSHAVGLFCGELERAHVRWFSHVWRGQGSGWA